MRDCVIVPTYQRPELLWCCLEAIRVAESEIPIHVFPDRGTDEIAICDRFNVAHHLTIKHSYHGNSYNMLQALAWANSHSTGTVFVIEDDAIVDPSFFKWSRQALLNYPEAFAACGWQYSPDARIGDGPDMLLDWYLSVAAAIPRRSLQGIVQHARPEYYSAMGEYLDRMYPASARKGTRHVEQDGAILRVAESEHKRCVWPRRPRAIHCGFRGYHMPEGRDLEGTLEEKVKLVKLVIQNPGALHNLMHGRGLPKIGWCGCGKPVLTEREDVKIVCVECFHNEYPDRLVTASSHYYLPRSG